MFFKQALEVSSVGEALMGWQAVSQFQSSYSKGPISFVS